MSALRVLPCSKIRRAFSVKQKAAERNLQIQFCSNSSFKSQNIR